MNQLYIHFKELPFFQWAYLNSKKRLFNLLFWNHCSAHIISFCFTLGRKKQMISYHSLINCKLIHIFVNSNNWVSMTYSRRYFKTGDKIRRTRQLCKNSVFGEVIRFKFQGVEMHTPPNLSRANKTKRCRLRWSGMSISTPTLFTEMRLNCFRIRMLSFIRNAFADMMYFSFTPPSCKAPKTLRMGENSKFPKSWTLEIQIFKLAWCLQKRIISCLKKCLIVFG